MIVSECSDVERIEPVSGVIHVAGIVRSPNDKVRVDWIVDGSSGSTTCEAWRGQYEIDCLVRAGYKILGVSIAKD